MAKRPAPPEPEPPEPPPAIPPPPRHAQGASTALAIPCPVTAPNNDAALINNALCRELMNPSGPPDGPDTEIEAICAVVNSVVRGTDLQPVKDEINRTMAHQPEKAAILNSQIERYERWTLPGYITIAANTHRALIRASAHGELSSMESLAMNRMALSEIQRIAEKLKDTEKQPSVSADSVTITEKFDPRGQIKEAEIAETFRHTTPHGREIIRKRLYTLKKQLYPDGCLPLKSANPQ